MKETTIGKFYNQPCYLNIRIDIGVKVVYNHVVVFRAISRVVYCIGTSVSEKNTDT
jgi:hypothetical protein